MQPTAASAKKKVEAFYKLGVELSSIVENAYQIVKSIPDPETKAAYAAELDGLIWELQAINGDIVSACEEYFAAEKAEGLPTDLPMRALYRQLKD